VSTIYDVARAAGVSPKTVSRVLNGDAPVGTDTRRAVTDAMVALGYVPSRAARMMRSNRSGLVGLITGAISVTLEEAQSLGLPELFIVQGIQKAMAKSGKTLMIADTGGDVSRAAPLIDTFLQHRVEGLIYVAEYHQKVVLPPVPADTPIVIVNGYDDIGTPAVLPDDEKGMHDLVEKLIEAGHTRIGYLTLREDVVATPLRLAGYQRALAEAGIGPDRSLIAPGELPGRETDNEVLIPALEGLLALNDPPTVICCGNDRMALRTYGLLRARGWRVPDDISIAGYDNYRVIAETLFPPLTTVDLPYRAMGERAAERLLSLIAGESRSPSAPDIVSGPVYWRRSVVAPKGVALTQTTKVSGGLLS
jgi:LacI family transcriptional regulator